jgi:hypothetical protein
MIFRRPQVRDLALTDAINGSGMGGLVSQVIMELTGTPGRMLIHALNDGLLSIVGEPIVRSLGPPWLIQQCVA